VGVLAVLLYFHGLYPHLVVKIQIDEPMDRILRLRLQVENKSDVAVTKEWAKLQILEHRVSDQTKWLLSADCRTPNPVVSGADPTAPTEWVPITEMAKGSINEGEEPLGGWKKPVDVMNSTIALEPNQVVTTDLLYTPSTNATAVHCALQIKISVDWFVRWVCQLMMGRRYSPQFTTTAWALVGRTGSVFAEAHETEIQRL